MKVLWLRSSAWLEHWPFTTEQVPLSFKKTWTKNSCWSKPGVEGSNPFGAISTKMLENNFQEISGEND